MKTSAAAYMQFNHLSFSEFYTAIDNILAKSDIFTTILKGKEEAN